jgi:hypothetical protein
MFDPKDQKYIPILENKVFLEDVKLKYEKIDFY